MLRWWILPVLFGCILIVSNPMMTRASAVPNWKSNVRQQVFDDCYRCHVRNQELERRIEALEANIREHVFDASLQEHLLQATPHSKYPAQVSDQGGSHVVPSSVRSKRQDNSNTNYSGCAPYPDYVESSQCTICGGNYARNPWQETCQGRCQQEINSACSDAAGTALNCLALSVCIDCSDVTATTPLLEQVPCPPDGYSGDETQLVVLLLDNNHHLNLTNAFNTGNPYAASIGGISLSNTTLESSQFTFRSMTINGNFNLSSATIIGSIEYMTAFAHATIYGNFDMSSANISGGISDYAFFAASIIDGNFDMSSATISGGITNHGLGNLFVNGNLSLTETTFLDGGIQAYSFTGTSVAGFLNASGARFPNDTLPVQMLFGLQVGKDIDFSHCNLKRLEQVQCASDGCFSLSGDDDVPVDSLRNLQGGPFTGMAMPVGVASTFIDLSHNNLTEISNTSLLGITASSLDLSYNQISVFHPFWFVGAPNAKSIVTTGNPSTCERNRFNLTTTEAYTYQETATVTCKCSSDTEGTGNFCAKQSCNETLQSLNVYSRAYLGGGYYKSRGDVVLSGDTATLQCPAGKHPNNDSAVSARCLGGAFAPQTNQCVTTSWFTPGRIAAIVIGVLVPAVIIAAIIGYVWFLSPEKRKGKLFQNEVELKERLLHDTNCDLEEATALNTRMRGAWKIEETDIQIGSVVASGAFGVVHDGKFAGLRVAVKVLKQPLDEELDPDVGIDFTRECETLMAIRHACLLIFYGAGLTSENRPFMVTEFMSKGSLKKVLADPREELGWSLRLKFAQQIAKGMEYLHNANIIHRDLKSDNCLVNDELDVKVCDFGTSKFLTAGRSTLQSSSFNVEAIGNDSLALSATMTKGVGTASWMAPELFVGGTQYKQEVDVYSFGIIMWELLTREIPWSEIEETQFIRFYKTLCSALENNQRPHVPPELIEFHHEFVMLMQRCWATNPQSRPTFKHVIELLA